MFRFFNKKAEKKEVEELKRAVQTGFNSAKEDINSLTKWVKHLNNKDSEIKDGFYELHEEINSLREEVESLKNVVSIVGDRGLFKQRQTVFNKQTAVDGVLNTVQTGVQSVYFDNLTSNERAIVFVLINSDMKLSYEDLAAMMGKNKSTIRGQINNIRQKNGGLIEEVMGENNKKRVFIPQKIKEMLLKTRKVREGVKKNKKNHDF